MAREDHLRIQPKDIDRLRKDLGVVWLQRKQTLQPGNKIDAMGAIALEVGVDATSFIAVKEFGFDKYGRDYMRGFTQGWDNFSLALKRLDNLESLNFMAGYEDGLICATHAGLIAVKPILDLLQLTNDADERDPVREQAPKNSLLLLERKRKEERTPEEEAETERLRNLRTPSRTA